MECHVEIKWSTTVCQGSSCSAITYFNFFTTLSDLGPWLEVPSSQADRVLSSYLLCPVCLIVSAGINNHQEYKLSQDAQQSFLSCSWGDFKLREQNHLPNVTKTQQFALNESVRNKWIINNSNWLTDRRTNAHHNFHKLELRVDQCCFRVITLMTDRGVTDQWQVFRNDSHAAVECGNSHTTDSTNRSSRRNWL